MEPYWGLKLNYYYYHQAVISGGSSVVVGMDLTLGYVFKLVLETFPLCRNESVRCFLFDDEGYLVVHPGNGSQLLGCCSVAASMATFSSVSAMLG